jgi:hypothetical protein
MKRRSSTTVVRCVTHAEVFCSPLALALSSFKPHCLLRRNFSQDVASVMLAAGISDSVRGRAYGNPVLALLSPRDRVCDTTAELRIDRSVLQRRKQSRVVTGHLGDAGCYSLLSCGPCSDAQRRLPTGIDWQPGLLLSIACACEYAF